MPGPNYRNLDKPPIPLHAIDGPLVQSMHRELRALYGVLVDISDHVGGRDAVEDLVREKIEEG